MKLTFRTLHRLVSAPRIHAASLPTLSPDQIDVLTRALQVYREGGRDALKRFCEEPKKKGKPDV